MIKLKKLIAIAVLVAMLSSGAMAQGDGREKSRTGKSGRSDSGSGRRFGHGLQQGDLNGGCDGQGRLGGILDQKGRD